ncbi:CDP-glycerol glycerophosphotransferase family protein [uncultured Lactobacillus sp.]|jgi:CDP-glycerol glycerophosphotransferase (TagB/SpsB family)|uniref:CDP-glycerol glycerophosphotransferase family protein n=1 Tax=uncultured Lactobacillus sp. TaxID=153152 RepID=UPI00258A239D|nr:CDP-glycerol glycerophosphotransferase family protein [uncultured Lactobacillus sp.]
MIKQSFIYKSLRHIYYRIYLPIAFSCTKLVYGKKSIQSNKIVVDNFFGRGMGDNPKYIVEALLKKNPSLDIVWQVSDKNMSMPRGVRKVKYYTPKALKELLTARVWIDNVKNSYKPDKRKGQFYLQTWHGGLGLKASEKQIENDLSRAYVVAAKRDASMTDVMLSDSKWTTDLYSKWFWYSGEIKKTGFPRNDILIKPAQEIINKVYNFYQISEDKKIILYAPTFRDGENTLSLYQFDFLDIESACFKKFHKSYVVLIKLHPNIAKEVGNKYLYSFDNNIINANDYPDMQELIVASDILITDYSSCMFDAMLANKKVFLLAKDYNKFIASDRHLLFDIKKDLPFSFSNNEKELAKNINLFDRDSYLKQINIFKNKVDITEDGNASRRVANIILKEMNKE